MKHTIRLAFAGVLLFFAFAMSGCMHHVSSNPAVVYSETLESASAAVDTVSIGLKAANDTVTTLTQGGTLEPEYYAKTHEYLVAVAKANDKAIAAIRAAQMGDTSVDWKSAVLAIADAGASVDPSTFGIKSDTAKKSLLIGLATLKTALTAIPASFGK